jgi:3-oxo-5-alpha-steroid 4-dehydrogenase 3 / polyprenol reductase
MHILHYTLGLLFYPLVAATILAPALPGPTLPEDPALQPIDRPLFAAALSLFFCASALQYWTHGHLAQLRRDRHSTTAYVLPVSGAFRWCSSPHYAAEVIIYCSLWLILPSRPLLAAVVFVSLNQAVAAAAAHSWYSRTFPGHPALAARIC